MFDLAGAESDRRFSPYCWRIRLALAHKGLELETISWRFTEKAALASRCQARACAGGWRFHWARCISPFQLLEPDDPVAQWRGRLLDAFGAMVRSAPGYDN